MIIGGIASLYGTFYALNFYLWLAYFRPESWVWMDFFKGQRLSLFVGVFTLLSTFVTGKKIKFTPFSCLLIVILIHSLISTLVSNYTTACWPYWIDFFKIILIAFLIPIIVSSEKEFKITIIVITLSLGLESAKQGWAQLILNPGAANDNGIPFLGDNNCVAVGMLMLAPISLALAQSYKKKLFKYAFFFLSIGIIYRAISTYSRGGFIALTCMFTIWWLRSKQKIRLLIIAALIAALIIPALPQSFWDRMGTITTDQSEMDASSSSRIHFWEVAFRMALSYPMFGVGHNGYNHAYNLFDFSNGAYGHSRSVHSMWFGILSEWGFIGLLLFLLIYFYSWLACRRILRKCRNNPELQHWTNYAVALEASLIAAATGGAFVPFQYVEMLWHFFTLAITIEQLVSAHELSKTSPLDETTNAFLHQDAVLLKS